MGKYVFAYKGGGGMAPTEEEQQQVMAAWGAWLGGLGDAVVEIGNPFAASKSVAADGSVTDGAAGGLTGFSVISAGSLDAAAGFANGCPIFAAGGAVEVYEAVEM